MGTCLKCHRRIPDGQKFCESCKQKRKKKADESYLDSLLSSVGGNQDAAQSKSGNNSENHIAYTDNNSISKSVKQSIGSRENTYGYLEEPSGNKTVPDDVDDMLSDLLSEMDEAGVSEEQPESTIGEDDIENIFDEAEAYATLLSKENGNAYNRTAQNDFVQMADGNYQQNPQSDNNGGDSELIDINWDPSQDDSENNIPLDNVSGDSIPVENNGYNEEMDDILLNEAIQGENNGLDTAETAFSDFDPLEEEIEAEIKPKKKNDSWLKRLFMRLFGNVNDEVTPEMIEADKKKKAEKEEIEKQRRAEKKKLDEEKRAEAMAEKERKKAEADAERNRKLALAIEKKNAAKEKEKKKNEQALAIAEYELEHGKINKAGATILFVIFAILTIVIIIGTNIYSYNLSIKNAQEDFDIKKYNEAYYEVYGLKIQDEDIELYDKIMTVMYVNHQLNAYEYYMTSKNKDKALDSLLKGLQRYDKYLQLAQRLGITDDLNYVKGEILDRLETEFDLTEAEAYSMVNIEDSVDYSEYLYGLLGTYEGEFDKYK